MSKAIVPLYLIILIVAIPQLSETIYVPSLPRMSEYFNVSANMIEMTMTTYLIGFGIGVLIWGSISDKYGRKPILITGFVIYAVTCILCYYVESVEQLLFFRLIQAIGASVGSVLGQAVARDVINIDDRARVFSIISMAMAFAPAVGPIIGGATIEYFTWNTVFLVLILLSFITIYLIISRLPETRKIINRQETTNIINNYHSCFSKMFRDKQVLGFGFMVGSVNGILFGYFAESPFYFIEVLGVSNKNFGLLSFLICIPLLIGSTLSKRYHKKQYSNISIIHRGVLLILISSTLFILLTKAGIISEVSSLQSIILSYSFIFLCMTGVAMIIPNCLSHALENYGNYAGTAASLFGFYYYSVIALMTTLMSVLHNGNLMQLPLFLFIEGVGMFIVFNLTLKIKTEQKISYANL